MRVAVTYDNGNVFGHFGRTEEFKVYDIEDGKVVNAQILGTNGEGCGALAGIVNYPPTSRQASCFNHHCGSHDIRN